MYEVAVNDVSDQLQICTVSIDAAELSYADVLQLWQSDDSFCSAFVAALTGCPFPAYRWETPPITTATIDRPFEFVLLNSPWLACSPDRQTFAEHFDDPVNDNGIVVFRNLGNDASLVVPSPCGRVSDYSHLAAFIASAPVSQIRSLWRSIGQTAQRELCERPIWISTAGGGVAWLHVRLDSRPKYYGYEPYKQVGRPQSR